MIHHIRTTGHSYAKIPVRLRCYIHQKYSKQIKDLNVRNETIKLRENNSEEHLGNLRDVHYFGIMHKRSLLRGGEDKPTNMAFAEYCKRYI